MSDIMIPAAYDDVLKDEEYIICRADGSVISSEHLKSCKAATKIGASSIFRYMGSAYARRLADAVAEVQNGYEKSHCVVGFEVNGMYGYNYASAEIHCDFGVTYMIVLLYKTKRDYLASDHVKNGRFADMISAHSAEIAKARKALYSGDISSAAAVFSDSAAFSSMLRTMRGCDTVQNVFDLNEANMRIAAFFSSDNGRRFTDCSVISSSQTGTSAECVFITKRNLAEYTEMIVALISTLALVSVSRIITVSTECFDGCARVTLCTKTENIKLKAFSSSDLGLLSDIVPRAQFRITKAEIIASSTGVRLFGDGSIADGTFSFTLIFTDEPELPTEFKHGDSLGDIEKSVSVASGELFAEF